jgi:hypothetical protein
MTKTVTRLFDTHTEALAAVNRLQESGIDQDAISIVSNNADDWHGKHQAGGHDGGERGQIPDQAPDQAGDQQGDGGGNSDPAVGEGPVAGAFDQVIDAAIPEVVGDAAGTAYSQAPQNNQGK